MYQATHCMVSLLQAHTHSRTRTHTHYLSLSLSCSLTQSHTHSLDVAKHIVAYKCVCETERESESKFQRSKESHSVSFYSRILITLCAYLVPRFCLKRRQRSVISGHPKVLQFNSAAAAVAAILSVFLKVSPNFDLASTTFQPQ